MRHGSLFSGIGGFDLAAEWMGWENVFHCEWNEFGQKVLKYHFPHADSHSDITKTDFTKYANKIDILTGGFPCQPFSLAGKRKGQDDERYLWHEMLRAIQEIKPKYVIAENVFGITNIDGGLVFEQVCLDLEAEGYEVQPFIIPAAAKNAPHRRDRVWFVAYRISKGLEGCTSKRIQTVKGGKNGFQDGISSRNVHDGFIANTNGTRVQGQSINAKTSKEIRQGWQSFTQTWNKWNIGRWQEFPTEPPICGGDDGLPTELDRITFSKWRNESIKAYGNAIVPQVAYEIFKALI
jgi:DNA (cytosine-5)-methyltransferase 1